MFELTYPVYNLYKSQLNGSSNHRNNNYSRNIYTQGLNDVFSTTKKNQFTFTIVGTTSDDTAELATLLLANHWPVQ